MQRVGDLTFDICRQVLDRIVTVPEGKVCTTILNPNNFDAIVAAGALSISALDLCRDMICGRNAARIVSGSNKEYRPHGVTSRSVAVSRGTETLLRYTSRSAPGAL